MRQKTYEVRQKKPSNIINIHIDLGSIPSKDRKYARLRNKAAVFDDRRFRKPKYKNKSYEE